MRSVLWAALLLILTAGFTPLEAAPPEIAYIHPGWYSAGPHVITGEDFLSEGLELWALRLPTRGEAADKAIREAGMKLGEGGPRLPAVPPKEARKVPIMDVEQRVLVADLYTPNTGVPQVTAVWLKNKDGFSAPYALNAALPYWVSGDETVPGGLLHIFGMALNPPYQKPLVLLRNDKESRFATVGTDPRGIRDSDPYLLYFTVPPDTPPGSYRVWVHNTFGGEYGWRRAGELLVQTPAKKGEAAAVIDVRRYGALGDGLANDAEALTKAIAAASEAGGGVVFLPPGTYRVDRMLEVPPGVSLRGAGRDNTIIEGFGYDPAIPASRRGGSGHPLPAPILQLTSRTGLASLTVCGAVSRGVIDGWGTGLVRMIPDPTTTVTSENIERVTISNCRLQAERMHPELGMDLYTRALFHPSMLYRKEKGPDGLQESFNVGSSRIRLIENIFRGSAVLSRTVRSEITGNRFETGGVGGSGIDSLLDANFFSEAPTRMLFYPRRHTFIRMNEMANYGQDSWNNAPESYLVHGGGEKTVGSPSAGASLSPGLQLLPAAKPADPARSLIDARQNWKPGQYKDAWVVITAGRGFGQYRFVVDNTANTLLLQEPWRVVPDESSEYAVGPFHAESVFYGNLNTGPGRLSLWLDCIGMVVERHRDSFAGGMDVWGADGSRPEAGGKAAATVAYHPSFYNMFIGNWLDGSDVSLLGGHNPANTVKGPVLFGNYVVRNTIRQPHMRRMPQDNVNEGRMGPPRAGVLLGQMSAHLPPQGRQAVSHSIIRDNFISFTGTGILIAEHARKSFLQGNEFQQVDVPVINRGQDTVTGENRVYVSDATGDRSLPLAEWSSDSGRSLK